MTQCLTLWIGDRLGLVERACFRSVLSHGHQLALYCYHPPKGVPEGVELRDAAVILGADRVFRHRRGSIAPFADWFRYELQRRGLGTWVDADIYLLAPLDGERQYLFGEQQPGLINNAILRLPTDSPMITALLRPFERGIAPYWLPPTAYLRAWVRQVVAGRADFARMPWGATGPDALTAVAKRFDLSSEALPAEVFYPVPWQCARWIVDAGIQLTDVISDDTVAIHLWNDCIQTFKDQPAPNGSFLARLQLEGRD